jgi:hypothetical protein
LRILTFNSHQPYLHLLATALPWMFGIVIPRYASGSAKNWEPGIRLLPQNAKLYASMKEALADGTWDWILTHNVSDLMDVRDVSLPKVFLVHGTLSGRILQDQSSIDRALYIKNLKLLLRASNVHVIYISELKRKDWGIHGEVITPGIDILAHGGYRGEIRGILQVCNNLKERGPMMGWATYQAVCCDLPCALIGNNSKLPFSRLSKSWDDLKEKFRSYRVYLYTPVYPYEDGYNLSLLEAMATGMPIATMPHPTSPVRDGIEGVVGSTHEDLRNKVVNLLDDPEEATKMGARARERVEIEFPIQKFQYAWESFASRLL